MCSTSPDSIAANISGLTLMADEIVSTSRPFRIRA
jgi:hypothetical protein